MKASLIDGATWAPRVAGGTARHGVKVRTLVPLAGGGLVGTDLDVEDIRLSLDETRAPFIQATITTALPDAVTLSRLDPRGAGVLVHIDFGYTAEDGTLTGPGVDWVELYLTSRRVNYPDNTVTLEASSHESVLLEAVSLFETRTYPADRATLEVLRDMTTWAGSVGPVDTTAAAAATPIGTALVVEPGQPYWPIMADLAERLNLWLYAPGGNTVLHLDERPTGTAPRSARLVVGDDGTGTITRVTDTLTRQGWASMARVEHRWTNPDGTTGTAAGYAQNIEGVTYQRTQVERRTTQATDGQAEASARAILGRMGTRGTVLDLEALAFYWLRPGQTVDVKVTPGGATVKHLLSRVEFQPLAGTMRVTTRAAGSTP